MPREVEKSRSKLLFFCRRKRQVTVSGRFSQKVVTDDRSWEVPNRLFYKSLTDPKSERELLVLCAKLLRDEKDLEESEDAIKTLTHARGKKQPDPKSERELLLLLLKLFRDEKKEEVEAEEAIRTLSSKSNKKQPELKKQRDL